MAPSNNSYLSNIANFPLNHDYGRKSIANSISLHVKSLGKFSVRPNCLNLNLFFCPVSSCPNSSPKSPREDSSLEEFFPKTSNPTQKKRILRTSKMLCACQVFWKIVQRYAKLSYKMSRRKRLPRRLRASHRCRPRGCLMVPKCSNSNQLQLRAFVTVPTSSQRCEADIHRELKFTKKNSFD